VKLCVAEIRRAHGIRGAHGTASYRKIAVWSEDSRRPLEFSSNKARLVCELLSTHGRPILSFSDGLVVQVDVAEEIVDIIDKLSWIKRNFTRPIYESLSNVVYNIYRFREELAPFILELELEDSGRR